MRNLSIVNLDRCRAAMEAGLEMVELQIWNLFDRLRLSSYAFVRKQFNLGQLLINWKGKKHEGCNRCNS